MTYIIDIKRKEDTPAPVEVGDLVQSLDGKAIGKIIRAYFDNDVQVAWLRPATKPYISWLGRDEVRYFEGTISLTQE